MVSVLFFYGLAFIFLGIILMPIRGKEDFLGVLNNFWALAFFAFIHGINEWVDMFILSGKPLDVRMLIIIGNILLPVSFIFIVLFAVLNINQRYPKHKWPSFIPVVCLLPWCLALIMGKGHLTAGIMARYFICFPGLILIIIDMVSRLILYKKELPRLVSVGVIVFISACSIYAVVSGLIVPKADFFPASIINYITFNKVFGFPVQILRMLCAIVMLVGAFGIMGVYYKKTGKVRLVGGLARKFLFFTLIFSSILIISSVLMSYLSGIFMLRKVISNQQQAIVQVMANSMGEMVGSEVKELENYVANPSIWGAVIMNANLRYSAMPVKNMPEYFAAKDKEWLRSAIDSALVREYLGTMLSLRLKKFSEAKGNIAEIFLTDRYGGLVTASDKTSDYYQADELWWQKTFNGGKGSIFIGEMEFDESTGIWSITIAVPVYNKDAEVIGVCKAVYNTLKFSDTISRFEIGSSGRAILFDNNGELICRSRHKLAKIESSALPEWNAIKKAQSKKSFLSSSYVYYDTGEVFLISWEMVPDKDLLQQGIKWTACVEQNTKEIFASQELTLLLYSIVLFVVLMVLSMCFSFMFVRLLIQPIEKMRLGMREIAGGNLNYYLSLRSGDELEDLADSFNLMIDTLRKTLVSKEVLIAEVAERKQAESLLEESKEKLEKQAQELNIQLKETEKSHEIMISMLEDNNFIRDELEKSLAGVQQAQEMMIQVAKLSAVGQLASGVAHEVKNPLGIILQGINYLEHKLSGREKDTGEVLEMMKDGITRADKIINGLLDFSKSSKLDLKLEDVNSVLESSVNLAQVSSSFVGVQITREMSKHIPKIRIDKNKIQQVFINLLVNAVQAMNNQGSIVIRSYVKKLEKPAKSKINKEVDYFAAGDEAVVVEIEDTGIGISEENLKKIFDAFFSTKGPKGGAGLGLGICLSIIDMHKGLIEVTSQEGKGTKVTVIFQASQEKVI
ncbi:MAG: ATP-binding protein [Candidatus Omnitrophota bacterium]